MLWLDDLKYYIRQYSSLACQFLPVKKKLDKNTVLRKKDIPMVSYDKEINS